MAGKSDFTEQEWEQLRKGATGAGLLVAVSDRSFFDTFKEASSLAKHVAGARADASQLVRDLRRSVPGLRPDRLSFRGRGRDGRRPGGGCGNPPQQGARRGSTPTGSSCCSSPRRSARRPAAAIRPRPERPRRSRPLSTSGPRGVVRARLPLGLRIRPHALRDPVDVVEVRDHLDRVVDRRVVDALRAERLRVVGPDRGRCQRQLPRVVAERTGAWVERRLAVVVLGM